MRSGRYGCHNRRSAFTHTFFFYFNSPSFRHRTQQKLRKVNKTRNKIIHKFKKKVYRLDWFMRLKSFSLKVLTIFLLPSLVMMTRWLDHWQTQTEFKILHISEIKVIHIFPISIKSYVLLIGQPMKLFTAFLIQRTTKFTWFWGQGTNSMK